MARSCTGLGWNIARNVGYHLALRDFGDVGFNPEGGVETTANNNTGAVELEQFA